MTWPKSRVGVWAVCSCRWTQTCTGCIPAWHAAPQPIAGLSSRQAPLLAVWILNFNFDQAIGFYLHVAASLVFPFPMGKTKTPGQTAGDANGEDGRGVSIHHTPCTPPKPTSFHSLPGVPRSHRERLHFVSKIPCLPIKLFFPLNL